MTLDLFTGEAQVAGRISDGIDLAVVLAANLLNLLLVIMFYLRARHKPAAGQAAGWAAVGLAVPLALAVILNLLAQRSWPFWLLPLITTAYCAVELLLRSRRLVMASRQTPE